MSSSTYNFNEFKTYLAFSFHTSGNCKLNNEIKNEISNHLGISQRTLIKHIKSLIDKKYFGYNPKTNSLFINGLKKIQRLVYLNSDCNERILSKTSFILDITDFNDLKFLTFSATEKFLLRYQSSYKKKLAFKKYLISNNFVERYDKGNDSERRLLKKFYKSELKTEGDSMKNGNPNHFGLDVYVDDVEYLGVSNSFISNRFNRTKSWGCKMKKKSSELSLLEYNKKFKFIGEFPLNFNVKKYLSINYPLKYNRFKVKKIENTLMVYETGYDEIVSNVSLTRRKARID
jgi:hypothetical protein